MRDLNGCGPRASDRDLGVGHLTLFDLAVGQLSAPPSGAPVCRRASLALTPDLGAPTRSRRWLAARCDQWGIPELHEDLSLATSELVTNAVLHARTSLEVTVTIASARVEVGVRDHNPRWPIVLPFRADLSADIEGLLRAHPWRDEGDLRHPSWVVGESGSIAAGRGLHLLKAVSDHWGISELPGDTGKEVWFDVGVPTSWPHRGSCVCADVPSSPRTASGRLVSAIPGQWDI